LESKLIQVARVLAREHEMFLGSLEIWVVVTERIDVAGAAQSLAGGSPRGVLPGVMHQQYRTGRAAAATSESTPSRTVDVFIGYLVRRRDMLTYSAQWLRRRPSLERDS
jgi:hypothetical protein